MNSHPSHSTFVRFVAPAPAVAGVAGALRVGLLSLLTLWRDHLERRRQIRAFDGIADMNEHLLKDIGASGLLTFRAGSDRSEASDAVRITTIPLTIRAGLSLLTFVLITAGTPATTAAATLRKPTGNAAIETQTVGIFTGTFVNGMPLYRLPPISVVAHRKGELARMEREEQQARVRQVRAKAAARRPA